MVACSSPCGQIRGSFTSGSAPSNAPRGCCVRSTAAATVSRWTAGERPAGSRCTTATRLIGWPKMRAERASVAIAGVSRGV